MKAIITHNINRFKTSIVLVDDNDYDIISKYSWYLSGDYAITNMKFNNKKIKVGMHRFIMNCTNNMEVDHIDHNSLNNQKSNLRIVTKSQNAMNKKPYKKQRGCSSKFKGVSWTKANKKWLSHIGLNNKQIHLGYFKNEIDAAKAYNKRAIELHGEYAYLNEV